MTKSLGLNGYIIGAGPSDCLYGNAVRSAACFKDGNNVPLSGTQLDANGYPTVDFKIQLAEPGYTYTSGVWPIQFPGQADIVPDSSPASVTSKSYSANTGLTTAMLAVSQDLANVTIILENTQRAGMSPGSGLASIEVQRPTKPGSSTGNPFGTLFHPPAIAMHAGYGIWRYLDELAVNNIQTVAPPSGSPSYVIFRAMEWADRTLPTAIFQSATTGISYEHLAASANAANCDVWIPVYDNASPDFIAKLALFLAYGSNALGQVYTGPVGSTGSNPVPASGPVWAPPTGRIHLTNGNEIWNNYLGYANSANVRNLNAAIAEQLAGVRNYNTVDADTNTNAGNGGTWAYNRNGYRIAAISDAMTAVFGSAALGTKIFPILEGQASNTFTLSSPLNYFVNNLGIQPKTKITSIGNDWYTQIGIATPIDGLHSVADLIASGIVANNYVGDAAALAAQYGLDLRLYEGAINVGQGSTIVEDQFNRDPATQPLAEAAVDRAFAQGATAAVVYNSTDSIYRTYYHGSDLGTPKGRGAITAMNRNCGTSVAVPAVSPLKVFDVTIFPDVLNLQGGETYKFRSLVRGGGGVSQNVTWTITGPTGSAVTTDGTVTAPAATSANQTLALTARSVTDSTVVNTATISVPPLDTSGLVLGPAVGDPSFEQDYIGVGQPAFMASNYQGQTGFPTLTSPWQYSVLSGICGRGSIYANNNGQGTLPPDGSQVGWIADTGSITQSIAGFVAGQAYQVRFWAAQRDTGGGGPQAQSLAILINGVQLGTVTPTGTTYQAFLSPPFTVPAGTSQLRFHGLAVNNMALLDRVSIVQAPAGAATPTAVPALRVPILADSSFEGVTVGPNPGQATSSTWTFAGGSGASAAGGVFNVPAPPDGNQVALLQGAGGTISQAVTLAAGQYEVTIAATQRPSNNQDLQLLVDGVVALAFTPAASWATCTSPAVTLAAGSHTFAVKGIDTAGGDNTAFVDLFDVISLAPVVPVTPVPTGEPLTAYTLLLLLSHGS